MIPTHTQIRNVVQIALQEDIGNGDITTNCIVSPDTIFRGMFIAKESGVIAGLHIAEAIFLEMDDQIHFEANVHDGEKIDKGEIIATVDGNTIALLSAERVALNFLQRMSGIATLTRQFVDAIRNTSAIILDTRKTAPGLRLFDKWAVLLGGGENHRYGLFDMVMIKDNHIAIAGSITEAVSRVLSKTKNKFEIEVEVKNLKQLRAALELRIHRILLDNMSIEELRQAVQITNGRIPLEASGNVDLDNVTAIAATGVNYISVGKLTHSAKALDISLLLQ